MKTVNCTNIKKYKDILEKQCDIEQSIQNLFSQGNYTFDKPLIVSNPYLDYPLTALILFKTQKEVTVTVKILDKDGNVERMQHNSKACCTHQIGLAGLYANSQTKVILEIHDNAKNTRVKSFSIFSKCKYRYIGVFNTIINRFKNKEKLYHFQNRYSTLVDSNGRLRWLTNHVSLVNISCRLRNGNLILSTGGYHSRRAFLYETTWIGRIVAVYAIPTGAHHHCEELPNGNLLVVSNSGNYASIENLIFEIDRHTGKIVRDFNLNSIIPTQRKTILYNHNGKNKDFYHVNGVQVTQNFKSIIISCRTQNALIKIDWHTKEIKWILGNPSGWESKYNKFFLTPVDSCFQWQYGQHAPIVIRETNDSLDILLFDNGTFRDDPDSMATNTAQTYSRGVIFHINEKDMTIKTVWEYGKDRAHNFYSFKKGNCEYNDSEQIVSIASTCIRSKSIYLDGHNYTEKTTLVEIEKDKNDILFEMDYYFDGVKNPSYRVHIEKGDCLIQTDNLFCGKIKDFSGVGIEFQCHNVGLHKENNDNLFKHTNWKINYVRISNSFFKLRGYIYVNGISPIKLVKKLVFVRNNDESYSLQIPLSFDAHVAALLGCEDLGYANINISRLPISMLPVGHYNIYFFINYENDSCLLDTGYWFDLEFSDSNNE